MNNKMTDIKTLMKNLGYGSKANNKKVETKEERYNRLKEREELQCKFFNDSVGNLNAKDGHNCDVCKNKGGYMKVKEFENGSVGSVYVECKCMVARSMIQKLKRSGLEKSIYDYSFEKYETSELWQKKLKDTALQFTKDDEHTWFYIGGQSGAGKTHLCTAITASYLRKNKVARYMLWRDEITKLKSIITESEKYCKSITDIKTADVLYIDDLFKMGKDQQGNTQRPTVSDVNIAFEILNYRYNNKNLVTVISSERSISDIMEIDEAIGGRIYELCSKGGYLINIKKDNSKNYRKKGIVEL